MTTTDHPDVEALRRDLLAQQATMRGLAMALRQAMLMVVNEIESQLDISPRTSQLRREAKGRQPERSA